MSSYDHDNKHWEELIGTIIDRIGIHRFVEMAAYVADQKGYPACSRGKSRNEILAASEQRIVHITTGRHSDD